MQCGRGVRLSLRRCCTCARTTSVRGREYIRVAATPNPIPSETQATRRSEAQEVGGAAVGTRTHVGDLREHDRSFQLLAGELQCSVAFRDLFRVVAKLRHPEDKPSFFPAHPTRARGCRQTCGALDAPGGMLWPGLAVLRARTVIVTGPCRPKQPQPHAAAAAAAANRTGSRRMTIAQVCV